MKLLWIAFLAHFNSHRSTATNFWSGIVGMVVNNILVLVGIWAMLFAGKEHAQTQGRFFLLVNFFIMTLWGVIHVFMGGLRELPNLIHNGGLDIHLLSPRAKWLSVSVTASDLPAWGDIIVGALGLAYFSFQSGFVFFANVLLFLMISMLGLTCFFLTLGALSFWFRRSDSLNNCLIHMLLGINTYPIVDRQQNFKLFLFLFPGLTLGIIPATFLQEPSMETFAWQVFGCLLLFLTSKLLFKFGLKRYQSSPRFTSFR
jgi:ABC-2 type transport system permease protein